MWATKPKAFCKVWGKGRVIIDQPLFMADFFGYTRLLDAGISIRSDQFKPSGNCFLLNSIWPLFSEPTANPFFLPM